MPVGGGEKLGQYTDCRGPELVIVWVIKFTDSESADRSDHQGPTREVRINRVRFRLYVLLLIGRWVSFELGRPFDFHVLGSLRRRLNVALGTCRLWMFDSVSLELESAILSHIVVRAKVPVLCRVSCLCPLKNWVILFLFASQGVLLRHIAWFL